MKFVQPPLKIDCEGLSQKLTFELADRLSLHFYDVDIVGAIIYASKPINEMHYSKAWNIIDRWGLKAE